MTSDTRIEDRGTWRIVTRGAPTPTIAAEYICPVHGRFRVDVARDANGEAPAEALCSAILRARTPDGLGDFSVHAYQTTEDPRPRCGRPSSFAISAPRAKVKTVEAVRGGYQKPDASTWTNTENLGEGQDYDDWVADRDKVWEADREASLKELIDG